MTKLDLELTSILGDKTLSLGCVLLNVADFPVIFVKKIDENGGFICGDGGKENMELMTIVGHPATIHDFHRWIYQNDFLFIQGVFTILIWGDKQIPYDSSKSLMDQSDETKNAMLKFILQK